MAENRKDTATCDMFERICERIQESQVKAAAQGAEIALQRFSDMTPWDLSTHEGRAEMRSTMDHSDTSRRICNAMKKDGTRIGIKAFWYVIGTSTVIGAAYILGLDLSRLKVLLGIK